MTEDERRAVGKRIADQRMNQYGSKSAAYGKASINAATWDRIEEGMPVREDRLIAAVKLLWPLTGGNWRKIPAPSFEATGPVFSGSYDDPQYIAHLEGWIMELQDRVEGLEAAIGRMLPNQPNEEGGAFADPLEGESVADYDLAASEDKNRK